MPLRLSFGVGLLAALFAASAFAQSAPSRTGQPDVAPAYGADEIAAILTPQPTIRGLVPGAGIEPGAPGSGVLPDLKVHFSFDSAELTPEAIAQLDQLGQALERDALRSYRFRISGHTDAVGSDEYNERLSQQRASAVVAYLSGQYQVDRDRLDAIGLGERELIAPDDPRSWLNRRVEVRNLATTPASN
jgi:outer membrane protein OmpA-like peptidoglycan-associated protein